MTRTYTATIGGETVTRRTEGEYAYATRVGGRVAFHGTYEAAKRRGGTIVRVVEVTRAPKAPAPGTPMATPTATAPTGCTITTAIDGRCGKPVVKTFKGTDGTVYGECAEHVI